MFYCTSVRKHSVTSPYIPNGQRRNDNRWTERKVRSRKSARGCGRVFCTVRRFRERSREVPWPGTVPCRLKKIQMLQLSSFGFRVSSFDPLLPHLTFPLGLIFYHIFSFMAFLLCFCASIFCLLSLFSARLPTYLQSINEVADIYIYKNTVLLLLCCRCWKFKPYCCVFGQLLTYT